MSPVLKERIRTVALFLNCRETGSYTARDIASASHYNFTPSYSDVLTTSTILNTLAILGYLKKHELPGKQKRYAYSLVKEISVTDGI